MRGLRDQDHSWQHPLGTARKLFCLPTAGESELRLTDLAMSAARLELQSWLCSAAKVPLMPSLFRGATTCWVLSQPLLSLSPQMLSLPGACASDGGTRAQIYAVCVSTLLAFEASAGPIEIY